MPPAVISQPSTKKPEEPFFDSFAKDGCTPRFVMYADGTVVFRKSLENGKSEFFRVVLSAQEAKGLLSCADEVFVSPYAETETDLAAQDDDDDDYFDIVRVFPQGTAEKRVYGVDRNDVDFLGTQQAPNKGLAQVPWPVRVLCERIGTLIGAKKVEKIDLQSGADGTPIIKGADNRRNIRILGGPCPVCLEIAKAHRKSELRKNLAERMQAAARSEFLRLKALQDETLKPVHQVPSAADVITNKEARSE